MRYFLAIVAAVNVIGTSFALAKEPHLVKWTWPLMDAFMVALATAIWVVDLKRERRA